MTDARFPSPDQMPARIDAVDQRARTVASGLADDLLRRRPATGGWSVGELLEHLVTSWDAYAVEIRRALDRSDLPRGNPAQWSPGFAGGFLLRSMLTSRRMPAPKVFRPVHEPRAETLDAFLRTTRELRELIGRAQGLDWNAIHVRSPVSGLIRVRLGAALALQVLHAERHLGQAERVRAEVIAG